MATIANISAIRTVAVDSVDLSRVMPPTTPSRIGGIASDPSRGLATLSFVNIDASRRGTYIVKALPINVRAGRQPGDLEGHEDQEDDDDRREIVVVQLVEFAAGGFTLHMVELSNRKPALGPCLVEVSEIGKDALKSIEYRLASDVLKDLQSSNLPRKITLSLWIARFAIVSERKYNRCTKCVLPNSAV